MENFSRAKNYDLSETRIFKHFPGELTISALSALCTDISYTSGKSKTSRGTHFLITDCPSKHKYYTHAFAFVCNDHVVFFGKKMLPSYFPAKRAQSTQFKYAIIV